MSIGVNIEDGGGTDRKAIVTNSGQLVVAPLHYDETSHNEIGAVDTAVNYFAPKPGKQFVITGLIYSADQQVSVTAGAVVQVYEARRLRIVVHAAHGPELHAAVDCDTHGVEVCARA